jgi:hypothetical protein
MTFYLTFLRNLCQSTEVQNAPICCLDQLLPSYVRKSSPRLSSNQKHNFEQVSKGLFEVTFLLTLMTPETRALGTALLLNILRK